MFTGITQGLFPVTQLNRAPNQLTYSIALSTSLLQNLQIGASVSVDGVCQTVTNIQGQEVTFQAIAETLQKTTLGDLQVGQQVSIERSATVGSEIGGHLLSGHIFGLGVVAERRVIENNLRLTFHGSETMLAYLFEKGFVGINGSSLTVNAVDPAKRLFSVDMIPHTLSVTDLGRKAVGDKVNIEVDSLTVTVVETVKRYFSTTSKLPFE
ncbi:MAG: riboflavin synthase subunit alpha [Gammaproteobacteria bacterium]